MNPLVALAQFLSRTFVLWVLLASAVALWQPQTFQFVLPYISIGLGLIMFGMGMSIDPADLVRVFQRPGALAMGVGLQFIVMPLLAFALATLLQLPPAIAIGFIVLGCCPGGTASNVICYLARADVPLSVSLTAVSTILATIFTPLLTLLLASQWMDVSFLAMFCTVVSIVFLPLLLGFAVHRYLPRLASRSVEVVPILSVTLIALIVGGIVGKNAAQLLSMGLLVFAGVVLHNGFGLGLGYYLPALLKYGEGTRRTISIEVGMQNSGLAMALVLAHFSPEAALPAAVFSVWHNISGPLLASLWQRKAPAS